MNDMFIKSSIVYLHMKTTKRLIGIGAVSMGVILDKVLLEKLGLKENDLVEIDFKKVE